MCGSQKTALDVSFTFQFVGDKVSCCSVPGYWAQNFRDSRASASHFAVAMQELQICYYGVALCESWDMNSEALTCVAVVYQVSYLPSSGLFIFEQQPDIINLLFDLFWQNTYTFRCIFKNITPYPYPR